ncbi:MAG: HD domain-containing protein [Aeromicrobium sp.]
MIGTREWLARTGGALTRRERLAHQLAAMTALTTDVSSRVRFRWAAGASGLDVDVAPPSTDLVRAASQWAAEIHQPWLLRHSMRTWLFGHLLGQLDGIESDPEALFLTCLLHDVGITDAHRAAIGDAGDTCQCFAAHGAHVTEAKLLELGASPLLASEVADAIGMHLNAKVGADAGGSARLVNQGAAVDVVGVRAADLGKSLIAEVLARHDRTRFADELLAVLVAENAARPSARMASFFGVGMGSAIRLNPLNRL